MKSTFKLIRRFVLILMLSLIGLVALNIVLLISFTYNGERNVGGWTEAEELADLLVESKSGAFLLADEGKNLLEQRQAWAILVDDGTGDVVWHSDNLPEDIPLHYSIADISWDTRGYIKGYPTTTAAKGDDLVIIGYPQNMYWKHMWNTWDYQLIANAPKMLVITLLVNIFFVILIYIIATSGVLRLVKPIVGGIEALPDGEDVYIPEKGLFSELAGAINRVSEKLRRQERALQKKESARANWISGVSHDIRTPLSMVMGYAGQLEEDSSLSEENRNKARIIRLQSVRMKNLVNDLNLSSKLEYNMQPMKREQINLVSIVRQVVADFMNMDLDEKYPISLDIEDDMMVCMIEGDKSLLLRAVNNTVTNAQVHNPNGCHISVCVSQNDTGAHIIIEDDGVGVTEEQLEKLKNTPHYIMSDGSTKEPRHGLGLLIVRQIAAAHNGTVSFGSGKNGGFAVDIYFRIEEK